MIGDVAQAKWDAMLFQDMPHRDAERRPGKLDQGEHGVYMTEARGKFKIEGSAAMIRRSESAIAWVDIACYLDSGRKRAEQAVRARHHIYLLWSPGEVSIILGRIGNGY